MQKTTEEVHNGLTQGRFLGAPSHERLPVTNHALHTLADMEDTSEDTLEYMSQEAAREFQISMSTNDNTYKGLCARRNSIARSL